MGGWEGEETEEKKNNIRPNKFKVAPNLKKHHDRSLLIGYTHVFPFVIPSSGLFKIYVRKSPKHDFA